MHDRISEIRLLRVPEVALITCKTEKAVYRMIAQRTLPSVHVGRSVRVPYDDLIAWLEADMVSAEEAIKNAQASAGVRNERK